jgi:hypothetical protein
MGNSHKNLLLRNHWANCNQTFVEWSLDGPLPNFHPRIISAKFGWDWLTSFRGEDFFKISSPFFLFLAWRPSWLEVGITGHKFGRGLCLFWPIMQIRKKGEWNLKKIFSETTEPISTKLCWNDLCVVPFQNCVRQRRPVSKVATF